MKLNELMKISWLWHDKEGAGQKIRYLVGGGWNTVFGYGVFSFLYWYLHTHIHYLVIVVVSNVLAISMAYISYKFFVFRTSGNYLREYIRFWGIYGISALIGIALFALCMEVLHMNAYLAQALILLLTIIFSFFGHKHFSFKKPDTP